MNTPAKTMDTRSIVKMSVLGIGPVHNDKQRQHYPLGVGFWKKRRKNDTEKCAPSTASDSPGTGVELDVVVPGDEGINISGVTVKYFNPNRFNS